MGENGGPHRFQAITITIRGLYFSLITRFAVSLLAHPKRSPFVRGSAVRLGYPVGLPSCDTGHCIILSYDDFNIQHVPAPVAPSPWYPHAPLPSFPPPSPPHHIYSSMSRPSCPVIIITKYHV